MIFGLLPQFLDNRTDDTHRSVGLFPEFPMSHLLLHPDRGNVVVCPNLQVDESKSGARLLYHPKTKLSLEYNKLKSGQVGQQFG